MIIKIQRTLAKGEITEGRLSIDGQYICDTLENSDSCLDRGSYPIALVKCKQYARKMICVVDPQSSFVVKTEKCDPCGRMRLVFSNTFLPSRCPMIKPGNGVHNRHDGSILVGTRGALGLIIHPKEAFDSLFQRIRKNMERGNSVTLEIIQPPKNK